MADGVGRFRPKGQLAVDVGCQRKMGCMVTPSFLEKSCQFLRWGIGGCGRLGESWSGAAAVSDPRCLLDIQVGGWRRPLPGSSSVPSWSHFLSPAAGSLQVWSLRSSFVSQIKCHLSREAILESSLQSAPSITSAYAFPAERPLYLQLLFTWLSPNQTVSPRGHSWVCLVPCGTAHARDRAFAECMKVGHTHSGQVALSF